MQCGISTACFYPTETREALRFLRSFHHGPTEIFLNTFSELEESYLEQLKEIAQEHQLEIASIHPFSSAFEPFLFFSSYENRFLDGVELYKKFFHACNVLGAKVLVFHGDTRHRTIDMKLYAERFYRLSQIAQQEYGVILGQENVERCCCSNPENIRLLREYTNDAVKFVLDVKQARRFGISPFDVLSAMGAENVSHLHLSDAKGDKTCITPGEGEFDFSKLFTELSKHNNLLSGVVELYNDNFESPQQLVAGTEFVNQHLKNHLKGGISI